MVSVTWVGGGRVPSYIYIYASKIISTMHAYLHKKH